MDDATLLSWIERGQNVAALLVAIGVAAEFLLGFMAGPARRRVDQAKDAEIIRLTNESAALTTRAVQLSKQVEDEKTARVELEASVAWRKLTKEQKSSLAKQLSKFQGQTVGFWYLTGDTEGERFAYNLVDALRAARWNALSPGPFIESAEAGKPWNTANPPTPLPTGVGIGSTPDQRSRDAAAALLQLTHYQESGTVLN